MPLSQEDQEEIDRLTAEYERLRSTGKWDSPLTPAEQAQWQHKARAYSPPNTVRYYWSGHNVYRVKDHEYSYLDHDTRAWIRHPSVYDSVVGYGGDASTVEISLAAAKEFARTLTRRKIEWL